MRELDGPIPILNTSKSLVFIPWQGSMWQRTYAWLERYLARGRVRTGVEKTIVGLDIGGSKVAFVEGALDAAILQRREVPALARLAFEEVFVGLASQIETLIENVR